MVCFICRDNFNDYLHDGFFAKIENMMTEALIEADFGADEVEIRFQDPRLLQTAIRVFNVVAKRQGYIYRIMRETEIFVFGVDGNKTRYTFMNSIPDES